MAKKRAKKKNETESTSPFKGMPTLLPGLGGVPWAPDSEPASPKRLPGLGGGPLDSRPKPVSRMDMERLNRAIGKLLAEQDFDSTEETNAFLATLTGGRTIDEIIDSVERDPVEEAQELAYLAMETESDTEARSYCRRALKLDPHCMDALVLQATITARSERDLATRLGKIVREAERQFGEAYFEENRGHFWGINETRPYMRARATLVALLHATDSLKEAIAECEGLLDLNPGDNQGNRDTLRGLYLEAGRAEGIRRLEKEYKDGDWAIPTWSGVLERWLSGDLKQAEKRARAGHKRNPHVVAYLSGAKRLPKEEPDGFSFGSQEEAALCASTLGRAWRAHPEAVSWLRGLNLK